MRYKAILFDLDGTLLDTLADLTASINHALSTLHFPLRTIDEIRSFVGNGVGKLTQRSLPAGSDEKTIAECLSIFTAHYMLHMNDCTKPYPGILAMLRALKQEGRKLAIVSNKGDAAVKELQKLHFPSLIDIAYGAPSDRKKPDPFCVHTVISALDIPYSECIYVGDSHVDVETARNAGLSCIGVSWGFAGKEALTACGPEYLIDSPEEIFSILASLEAAAG